MFLESNLFKNIVQHAPLISIDLCIIDNNKILLGKRINNPAKENFFVPGGRIRKNETIEEGFNRILRDEVGAHVIGYTSKKFLGIYQHFYDNNFLNTNNFNTHYIVLAYKINLKELRMGGRDLPKIQHSKYVWHELEDNDSNLRIHKYTKDYFRDLIKS